MASVNEMCLEMVFCFFFQAEDGIRDLVRSRGLGDVYKRQLVQLLLEIKQTVETVQDAGRMALAAQQIADFELLSLIHI